MPLKLITDPVAEPVSLQEAKLELRLITDPADETPHPDDGRIAGLIVGARRRAEFLTERSLMLQTWELALDQFCEAITLPKPPFVAVTSVKYIDTDGALKTLDPAAYSPDSYSEPAKLMPVYGGSWPATRRQPNAVLIRYEAGYADASAVPQEIKDWMLLRICSAYANRESVVVGASVAELPGVDRLLDGPRIWGC